jgi:hypothetical protein
MTLALGRRTDCQTSSLKEHDPDVWQLKVAVEIYLIAQ